MSPKQVHTYKHTPIVTEVMTPESIHMVISRNFISIPCQESDCMRLYSRDNDSTFLENLYETRTFIIDDSELSPTNDKSLVRFDKLINSGLKVSDKAVTLIISFCPNSSII